MKQRRGITQDPPAGDVEALFVPRRSALQDVPIARILPNPFQARQTFDAIEELAEAIRVQGFTSRLRLRPHSERPGYFQLVYGERRLRAAQAAGLTDVPCEIADHSDAEMIEIGLSENIQRRDLDPLEEARALRTIIDAGGYTIRGLAARLGKSRGYIDNRLALLRAPEDVQQLVAQHPGAMMAARDLARVDPAERAVLMEELRSGAASGAQVREQVRELADMPRARESIGGFGGAGAQVSAAQHRRLMDQRDLVRTILAEWRERARTNQDRDFLESVIGLVADDVKAIVEELEG